MSPLVVIAHALACGCWKRLRVEVPLALSTRLWRRHSGRKHRAQMFAVLYALLSSTVRAQTAPTDLTELPIEQLMQVQVVTGAPEHAHASNKAPANTAGISEQRLQPDRPEPVGSDWIANLTLPAARLAPKLEMSAGTYNLFDLRYADPTGQEQPSIQWDGRAHGLKFIDTFR